MEFYKPQQGDTAGTVADGYDRNFRELGQAKVDRVEGSGLMTDEEREKLSGIEEGANAYEHPASHPASMIADTAEKVMMTVEEREKLSGIEEGANAYELPIASDSVLGGVKVGAGLEIDADGTLSAPGGSGGGGYVLPKASAATLGGIKVGNNLSIREDGTLDAQAGSGGNINGLEIGTQNLVPTVKTFTKTLEAMEDLAAVIPILSDDEVIGDGTNRAFAVSGLVFVGDYLTVDQPTIAIMPGWQIVVILLNPLTMGVHDTYTLEGSKWPETYPKTYNLGETVTGQAIFIIRKSDNSAFEIEDIPDSAFVVCRGNQTIGAAPPYESIVIPAVPTYIAGNIVCTIQDGKFTGVTNSSQGVTLLDYKVNESGDEVIAYIRLKANSFRETLTAYSFEEVYTEVTQGRPSGSSYPVPALRMRIKTSIANYSSGIAFFYSYWAQDD